MHKRNHIAVCFKFCVLCTLGFQSAWSGVVYSSLDKVEGQIDDSSLIVSYPMSIGKDSEGNVIALDSQLKRMIVGDGETGSVYYERAVATGIPYSIVTCPSRGASIVSYAQSKIIDTLSNSPGTLVTGLDYKKKLIPYGDVIISDLAANEDCSLLYILDGVNKVLYVADEQKTTEPARFFMSLVKLSQPTSVLLSVDTHTIFVADWERAEILEMAVNAVPRVLHRLVGDGAQHPIKDKTSTQPATLSGPTQLAHYKAGGAILFTDRNPILMTSAVRILQTTGPNKGNIETIAGGNSRGWVNGDHDQVKLNAVWDVTYIDSKDEIYVSEPLVGNIRRVHNIDLRWEKCPAGQWMPENGHCEKCPEDFYCPGTDARLSCGSVRESVSGASSEADCWCMTGTYAVGDDCVTCPANRFCTIFTNTSTVCQEAAYSARGQTTQEGCLCRDGFFADGSICKECPSDSYCQDGIVFRCPAGSSSLPSGNSIHDCSCDPGKTKTVEGQGCRDCAPSEVCSIGSSVIETVITIELPEGLPDKLDGNAAKDLLSALLNSDIVLADNVEITIRLKVANSRRLLSVQYDVIIKMIVGGAAPSEINTISDRLNNVLRDPVKMTQIIQTAAPNATISQEDIYISTPSLTVVFEAAQMIETCEGPGETFDKASSICLCQAGYKGTPPVCVPCPENQYKAKDGRGECSKCPEFSSVPHMGSSSITECICEDGYFFTKLSMDTVSGGRGLCKKEAAIDPLILGGSIAAGVVVLLCQAGLTIWVMKKPGFRWAMKRRAYITVVEQSKPNAPGNIMSVIRLDRGQRQDLDKKSLTWDPASAKQLGQQFPQQIVTGKVPVGNSVLSTTTANANNYNNNFIFTQDNGRYVFNPAQQTPPFPLPASLPKTSSTSFHSFASETLSARTLPPPFLFSQSSHQKQR